MNTILFLAIPCNPFPLTHNIFSFLYLTYILYQKIQKKSNIKEHCRVH
jgi:hypothetical protein